MGGGIAPRRARRPGAHALPERALAYLAQKRRLAGKPWAAATLCERLELPDIFVPEREQAVVHLAQGVEKYRYVDVPVLVPVF